MKLEEALKNSTSDQYISRMKWIENGSVVKLLTSEKTIEKLNIFLSSESVEADDWEIFNLILDC